MNEEFSSKIKNTPERLNSSLSYTEEHISYLEDRIMEITQ